MSLPNYLAKIKSSGFYRFVWDKSVIQPQQAETLRLLIGYSEKGPFNTPVYISSIPDFISVYGNISKRLEKKGIYFHRLAIQALSSGPILAMNIKPFNMDSQYPEKCDSLSFNPSEIYSSGLSDLKKLVPVTDLYDKNRFWHLDADQIPENIKGGKYINVIDTDVDKNSCSFFIRQYKPSNYRGITFRDWYAENPSEEVPSYMEGMLDKHMEDYFVEIYTFRGEFLPELCDEGGALEKYFKKEQIELVSKEQKAEVKYKYYINDQYVDAFGVKSDALDALASDPKSRFVSRSHGILIPYFKDNAGNYISLDVTFNADNYQHKMMMKLNESLLEETPDKILEIGSADKLYPIYFKGYKYESVKSADTGITLQNKILSVLSTEKGIRTALTNRVDVEYHYIVDTFQSYINDPGCKSKLALIAKEKDNAFAILNMPPMMDFVKDPKSKFNDANGKFDISKIADPKNGFTLASDVSGASWCAYFTQVTFSDGTIKTYVPSAALVSNNFMEKYKGRQPYYTVAGPTYGVINYDGMVGPDYNYGRTDLDVLEPMGVNAIIYIPRKGTYINSNQTAKQAPLSALSKIHVRELVIYLQNEIEYMLQNYQWELNTQTLRDTIKSKADYILDNIKNNNGIQAYTSVCDETNNPPEVVDNEMVVIDIAIEPSPRTGKMVQTLTIHRTGGIASSVG